MFQNGQHRGGSSFLDIAQCMLNWQSLSEGETLSWRFQIENLSYNGHLELSFFFCDYYIALFTLCYNDKLRLVGRLCHGPFKILWNLPAHSSYC